MNLRLPDLSSRVGKIWLRNKDVFLNTYKTAFLTPLFEPILYLFALGFGLGGFVQLIDGIPYIQFIAPALVASSMMFSSYSECSYASFVRMYYQKTFDAIIATPINLDEVIAGEILWGATRGLLNSMIVLGVVAGFGLVTNPLVVLILPLSFVAGLLFASIAMCFTAIAPNIEALSYPYFLFITPMFLFSGTFFPFTELPTAIQFFAQLALPLTHVVTLVRDLFLEGGLVLSTTHLLSMLWILVATPIFFVLAINLMRRRLIE